MLLEAGANLQHKNKEGETVLDKAIDGVGKINKVVGLLLNEGAIVSKPEKMLAYLQRQDKNDVVTLICYHLFYQQQENFHSAGQSVHPALLLSPENFEKLLEEITLLPMPPKEVSTKHFLEVYAEVDKATNLRMPTDLVDLIAQYDNPFQRFGIFKYKPECKPEGLPQHELLGLKK